MSLYAVEIDPSNLNTSHGQVVDLVGRDRRVLDVGCWTGDLGVVLADRGCQVSGFEIDPEAAAVAVERLGDVRVGNLDHSTLSSFFAPETFDVIVFADVLEHVHDPGAALRDASTLLAADGRIVVSIPNIGHGSARLAHLQGAWRTTDTGLLDHTHIRFFTREGLIDLVHGAGLVIEDLRGTVADPLAVEVEVDEARLPDGAVEWVRDQPDALVYQFQLACRPRRDAEPDPVAPDLVPGADPYYARRTDRHTLKDAKRWRRSLVARDALIGSAAQLEVERERAARSRDRIRSLEADLAEKKSASHAPTAKRSRARALAGRIKRRLAR